MSLTRTMRTAVITTSALALLAGCAADGGYFTAEVGTRYDGSRFGSAVENNTLIHSGQRQYVIDLAERFNEEVPDTITFAFNSAAIDGQARQILARQAAFIKQFPEVTFRVYGHTDKVGSNAANKRLGLRRAQAVVNYFASAGISRSRLEAVVSYGETQPVIATESEERRNRRTVTEVSGFVQDDPLVLNGKYAEVLYREYVDSATQMRVSDDGGLGTLDAGIQTGG